MSGSPARAVSDGVELFIRLTPRANADRITGIETSADGRPHLAARVRAVPEKGSANTALVRLVAETFDVPRSSVEVTAGATQRLKTVRITGDPDRLVALIESKLGAATSLGATARKR
jgi:uncharacterized protein (TIGR00251 family)